MRRVYPAVSPHGLPKGAVIELSPFIICSSLSCKSDRERYKNPQEIPTRPSFPLSFLPPHLPLALRVRATARAGGERSKPPPWRPAASRRRRRRRSCPSRCPRPRAGLRRLLCFPVRSLALLFALLQFRRIGRCVVEFVRLGAVGVRNWGGGARI